MTTTSYLPMVILAVILISAIAVLAYLTLKKWRTSRAPSDQVDPDAVKREWLVREAHSAVDERAARHLGNRKPFQH